MMPNPLLPSMPQVRRSLIRAGVLAPGRSTITPPVDQEGKPIPAPIQPQEEGRQAYIPYRGTEMHGVASPTPAEEDAEGYGDGTVTVHYSDEHEHVLPVRIVSGTESETMTRFRTSQSVAPVAGERPAVQIAARNRSRTKVKILNMATADGCWIGPDNSVSALNGWWLAAGASLDLSTTEEVYAVSGTANAVPLSILAEDTQPV